MPKLSALLLSALGVTVAHASPLTLRQLPRQVQNDGTVMPVESMPHLRTLMVWPTRDSVYTEEEWNGARDEVASIANTISRFEPVWLYSLEENIPEAESRVSENVTVKPMLAQQLWIRDSGPTFVENANGSLAGIDFNFNYWGEKLDLPPGWDIPEYDRNITRNILAENGIPRIESTIVTEGGAIEVDGEGTLISSDSALVNDNRNPNMTQEQIEETLKAHLGAQKMIWLLGDRGGDITDWHIDAQARFAGGGRILMSRPNRNEPSDTTNWRLYNHNIALLRNQTDAMGRPIEIIDVEEADTSLLPGSPDRTDMVVSYVNYYLVNGAIIVPTFGDQATDDAAFETFQRVFPEREVAQVPLAWIPRIGGGIHCSTQQWPAAGY